MEKRSALTISMVQSNFTNGMKSFVPYNPFRENSPFLAIKSKTYGNWYADFLNHIKEIQNAKVKNCPPALPKLSFGGRGNLKVKSL